MGINKTELNKIMVQPIQIRNNLTVEQENYVNNLCWDKDKIVCILENLVK